MKTFVIVGATSDTGKVVAMRLEDMGHTSRKVSRKLGISIDNEKALRETFSGADGAYLVIPFDMQAPDLHKREDEIGKKLVDAIQVAGLKRVVLVSALYAHLNPGENSFVIWNPDKAKIKTMPPAINTTANIFGDNIDTSPQ